MPYEIKKQSTGKYAILNKDSGKVVGHSDTKEMAKAAMRARYAVEGGYKMRNK